MIQGKPINLEGKGESKAQFKEVILTFWQKLKKFVIANLGMILKKKTLPYNLNLVFVLDANFQSQYVFLS